MKNNFLVGIDSGGTFTDFVLVAGDDVAAVRKVPSNPANPVSAVLRGLHELSVAIGVGEDDLFRALRLIVHGTTVTTNAVLTRSGADTAVLTTKGFRDMLHIRLGIRDREHLYDSRTVAPEPLVPRYLRFGVEERVDKDGQVVVDLDDESVLGAVRAAVELGVTSIACAFIHSYKNSAHEERVQEIIRQHFPELDVSLSSFVSPSVRIYPRLSTTVLNAYTRPVLGSYFTRLERELQSRGFAGQLLVMQSNGGVAAPAQVERLSSATLLSGPAAGPTAGLTYGLREEAQNCVVIDMGGTSFDVSVVEEGKPLLVREAEIDKHLCALPMVGIHTIGAGGGSIAWVDQGGLLHVGPSSAGAIPGPACYGRGGTRATVTDADLVLGYVDPAYFLGGEMPLIRSAAEEALERSVAMPLGVDRQTAAVGVYDVVNLNMVAGIREVTVKRGIDPREFALIVAGGAGAIHAAPIALELGIDRIVVPSQASVLCALGMLVSDLRHDYVATFVTYLSNLDFTSLAASADRLKARGLDVITRENVLAEQVEYEITLDMRYRGQHREIGVVISNDVLEARDASTIRAAFEERHRVLFGYDDPQEEVEILLVRVACFASRKALRQTVIGGSSQAACRSSGNGIRPDPIGQRLAYQGEAHGFVETPVHRSAALLGQAVTIPGPAIVECPMTTALVIPEFALSSNVEGDFVMERVK
ncbi:MAG: hydantoinase/oxoprolinase family protein [Chloroflexi bacterium]|nr:hydantoinase/oxoprolinase family protein [Chloroflexota bacterium]